MRHTPEAERVNSAPPIHLEDPEQSRSLAEDLREIGLVYPVADSPLRPDLIKSDPEIKVGDSYRESGGLNMPPPFIDPNLAEKVMSKLGMQYQAEDSK